MKTRESGFTWIELVLALIILGIVAAIFYPVFAKVHDRGGRHSSCLSNLKQLGLAFQQYTQDFDDKMPGYQFHPGHSPTNPVNGTAWIGPMWSYIKSDRILKCPSDGNTSLSVLSGFVEVPVSYAMNSNVAMNPQVSTYPAPVNTVLVFEVSHSNASVRDINENRTNGATQVSAAGNGVNGRLSSSLGELPSNPDPIQYATGPLDNSSMPTMLNQYTEKARHTDGSNFLLADGHAKWFRPSAVSAGGIALKTSNPQSQIGCADDGSKHPGLYPCAEGTANGTHHATFSVN